VFTGTPRIADGKDVIGDSGGEAGPRGETSGRHASQPAARTDFRSAAMGINAEITLP